MDVGMLVERKWFDLATARGWIEVAGALVGVVGAVAGIYLKISAAEPSSAPKHSPAPSITQVGEGNVVVGRDVVTFNISGYTIEEHEERLRKRELELRADFQSTAGKTGEERTALEQELETVKGQLDDIEESYKDRLSELERVNENLKRVGNEVPAERVQQAVKALEKGDTEIADTIVAEVEGETEEKEPNNEPRKSNPIALNTWITGDIGDSSDGDFYAFVTPPTHRDWIHVELDNRSTTLRPGLDFYDADKVHMARREIGTPGANLSRHIVVKPETKYYLRIGNYNNSTQGAYFVRVKPLEAYDKFEPNQTILKAKPISLDSPIEAGIMDTRDVDYYRVTTGASGGTLVARLENRSTTLRPGLDFYNADKAHMARWENGTPGANLSRRIKAEPNTDYFIRVSNYNNGTQGNYTLTVEVQ